VRDLAQFPELIWLERLDLVSKLSYIAGCYLLFGFVGVVWGFFIPAVIVLQMIHWIQSVSHSIGGYRRYPTLDNSRNHWLFGVLSLGEGFHHNHHYFPNSARIGLRWWEFDAGYFVLLALERFGLIWNLKKPRKGPPGRDAMERDVTYVRAKIRKTVSKLDAGIASIENNEPPESRAAYRYLRNCLMERSSALSARVRELLVRGPVFMQTAVEEFRVELKNEASRLIPQTAVIRELVDSAILSLPSGVRAEDFEHATTDESKLANSR
jgi:hypothetical protein